MKLDVPLIYQKNKSVDCGPACISMILSYKGQKKSVAEIKKELRMIKGGTIPYEIGCYLQEQGIQTQIVTLTPQVFVKSDTINDVPKRIKALEAPVRKKMNKYIESGGVIKPGLPTLSIIEHEIKAKRPIICHVTTRFMHAKKPKFNLHYNVITGITSKHIYLNDPSKTYGGKKKVSKDDFLFALYAAAASYGLSASLILTK